MDSHLLAYGLAGVALLYLVARLTTVSSPNLNHIPTIGPSGSLASYWGALRFLRHSKEMTEEGYKKYRNGMFKVASIDKWLVFCCGHQLLEDIRKASDDELSIDDAMEEMIQVKYTLGDEIRQDQYHLPIIRNILTRNLGVCYPEIHDEIVQSLEDLLSLEGNEWKSVPGLKTVLSIVCRTSNRIFVGLPLCRDPSYLELNKQFTVDVVTVASFLNLLPAFIRPIVGRCISKLPGYVKRGTKLLATIIEERMKMEEEYGKDWPGKPNDALTWFMEQTDGSKRTHRDLILRILTVNMAAVHTTSMAVTHALYYLAANPEFAASLREEVELIVKEDGWTKSALDRMVKVDSFLRESQRLTGSGSATMSRKVVKDFTFSDGTVVPAGAFINVPLSAWHQDEANYSRHDVFDPYRFVPLKEPDGSEDTKQHLVTPSSDYLAWGFGKHTCPGRFFAAVQLKTVLAHIVVSYDVKVKNEGVRPADEWFVTACIPNTKAEVLFRRRVA